MTGLSTLLFTLGFGLGGGSCLCHGHGRLDRRAVLLWRGWIAILVMKAADPGALAVQALTACVTMGLALRWMFRHAHWKKRITKDRREAEEKQQQVRGVVDDMKGRMAVKVKEVDRGLKQYEMVKRLAEAMSWEEMSPSLDKSLKHFFHSDGWALYLTDEKGELELIQRRGVTPDPRPEDLPKKEPYLHTFIPESRNRSKAAACGLLACRFGVCMNGLDS